MTSSRPTALVPVVCRFSHTGIYDADKLIAMRLDAMKKKTAEAVAPAAS